MPMLRQQTDSDSMQEEKHTLQKRARGLLKRHTAKVAAGFIRYHVLIALNDKPQSGSELIENFEKNSGGVWKPSPGSIYPLLAHLQSNGCLRELPAENGIKRYELNERGKSLLEEQKKLSNELQEILGIQYIALEDFLKAKGEETLAFQESYKHGNKVWYQLSKALQENYSKEALDDLKKVLDESSAKFERIIKKINGEKN